MLGTSNTSVEIINLARSRGVYTITTDYMEPEKSLAKLVSDEYWMIDTSDLDALEKKCREEGVSAVIAGVSEFNIEQMMKLCRRLDLPCWCTPESWNALQKKHEFKKLCRENGVRIAKDYFLSNPPTEKELAEIEYPVVVKPVDQWLSRGVSYCYTKEEVVRACEYARSISKVDTVIVEQKLTGHFCMAHCALAEGEATLLAVATIFSSTTSPYTAVTVSSPRLWDMYEKQAMPNLKKLLKAADCRNGVCWTQSFLSEDDRFYTFEMGYRNSGDMMTIPIHQATGFDSMSWLLDTSLGIAHTVEDLPLREQLKTQKHACKYTAISLDKGTVSRIEGVEQIKQIPGIRVWMDVKEGQVVAANGLMMRFVFVADTLDEVCEIVDRINSTVKIYDENGKNFVRYFDNNEGIKSALVR